MPQNCSVFELLGGVCLRKEFQIGCAAASNISNDPRNLLSLVGYITDTTR
jgi:hypothetical protein